MNHMSDDFEPIIVDVPQGHRSRGTEVFSPVDDKGYYERVAKGRISVTPSTHYCPSCSATHELSRWGKIQRKWFLEHGDLQFKLSYKEDKDGELYATCNACGFDLRDEVSEFSVEPPEEKEMRKDIYLDDAKYQNGCYYIKYEDFKSALLRRKNDESIKVCIKQKIGPSLNIMEMKDEVFRNASDCRMDGDRIGIPRTMWRNT